MMKTGFSPQLMTLEGRDQPGSVFSTGLDASILAGAFLGDALVRVSRPAIVATQAPTKKTDAHDVAVQPLSHALDVQSTGTIKQTESTSLEDVNGLGKPALTVAEYAKTHPGVYGSDSGSRALNLFYGGDFDGRNGLANEKGGVFTDSRTYDDVRIRNGWNIDCLFSRNLESGLTTTTANWSIRGPGQMSTGNGLAIFASGNNVASTHVATGFSGFGLTEFQTTVCGLNLSIPSGHYYINVQPNATGGVGLAYESTTSGAGPIKGQPIANGNTWFDSGPQFGLSFVDAQTQFGAGTWDFSGGIQGTLP